MAQNNQVSPDGFESAITPTNFQALKLIHFALGFGPFVFFIVILYFHFQISGDEGGGEDTSLLDMLSLVHAVIFVSLFSASKIVYELFLKNQRNSPQADTAEGCFSIIRQAWVIRLAFMEGAAFFGLVTCFAGSQFGLLHEFPIYWLNIFSSLALIAFILVNIPTKDSLVRLFQYKLMK